MGRDPVVGDLCFRSCCIINFWSTVLYSFVWLIHSLLLQWMWITSHAAILFCVKAFGYKGEILFSLPLKSKREWHLLHLMKANFKSGLLTDWIQQSEHDIGDVPLLLDRWNNLKRNSSPKNENVLTHRTFKIWVCFFIWTDLEKFSISSLAHQRNLCSEWVPSE